MKRKYRPLSVEDWIIIVCGVVALCIVLYFTVGCSSADVGGGKIKCENEDDILIELKMECKRSPHDPQGEGEG